MGVDTVSCWVTDRLQECTAIHEQEGHTSPPTQRMGVLRRHPRMRTMTPRWRRTWSAPPTAGSMIHVMGR
eukprot:XP_001707983.1 Hypothetical protein GL50803_123790 [Giardia lamblia ATCC 50803]